MAPLADRLRPSRLDEVVGQRHILAPGKLLYKVAQSGQMPNMIFYGPSGVGKTTVARILAQQAGKKLFKLNGTTASTADIKEVVEQLNTIDGFSGVLLYLDEIQYLNKKQQQTLLEYIEDGRITLIASTTENPYFYIYGAILSRSTVFEFRPVEPEEIQKAIRRGAAILEEDRQETIEMDDDALVHISRACGGDVRKALNALEMCCLGSELERQEASSPGQPEKWIRRISLETAVEATQRSSTRYDRDGDAHYDILSAFQKSIRGSDENAALHYLARLLTAGDLISACRRLLVTASEDIGLAYPSALPVVKACVDAAMQLGLPEAQFPLAQGVVLLCTAPKSNSSSSAILKALEDVQKGDCGDVPDFLKDGHYQGSQKLDHGIGYVYPHPYPGHYYPQPYLPEPMRGRVYYQFGDNKTEQAAAQYRKSILEHASKEKRPQ